MAAHSKHLQDESALLAWSHPLLVSALIWLPQFQFAEKICLELCSKVLFIIRICKVYQKISPVNVDVLSESCTVVVQWLQLSPLGKRV